MRPIYQVLLCLYPRAYQTLFAREMLKAFEEASEDFRERGIGRFLVFAAAEFFHLITEAGVQWAGRIRHTLCHTRARTDCRCLPDIAKARPPWVARDAYHESLSRALASKE